METKINKEDISYMELTKIVSKGSKDRSTKVGSIIVKNGRVLSSGCNNFPNGVNCNIDSRHERPAKYMYTVHSEANAIISAGLLGYSVVGADMYLNWFPCANCSGLIVNSGIKRIFCSKEPDFEHPTYGEEFKVAIEILNEGDVEIIYVTDDRN